MAILRNTRRAGLLSLPITCLLLTSCGGSSSSSPAIDVTGHWLTYLEDPNTMEEEGPSGNYLTQNGATVNGVFVDGTVSGSTLSIDVDLPGLPNTLQFTATMVGQDLNGTYSMVGVPITGNFRMVPFTPSGTITANGTVGGRSVAVNSSTSFGRRSYSDQALTTLQEVAIAHDDGTVRFELDFPQTGSLAVGNLDASSVPVQVYFADANGETSVLAQSGSVNITQYDASGFAGTFNLTLPGSEIVTGSFSVVHDINSYDP